MHPRHMTDGELCKAFNAIYVFDELSLFDEQVIQEFELREYLFTSSKENN